MAVLAARGRGRARGGGTKPAGSLRQAWSPEALGLRWTNADTTKLMRHLFEPEMEAERTAAGRFSREVKTVASSAPGSELRLPAAGSTPPHAPPFDPEGLAATQVVRMGGTDGHGGAATPEDLLSPDDVLELVPDSASPTQSAPQAPKPVARRAAAGGALLGVALAVAWGAGAFTSPRPALAPVPTPAPPPQTAPAPLPPVEAAAAAPAPAPEPPQPKKAAEPARPASGKKKPKEAKAGPVEMAAISLQCRPWARIVVDGKDTGRFTPVAAMALKAGAHTIELVNDDLKLRLKWDVKLKPGETATFSKELK